MLQGDGCEFCHLLYDVVNLVKYLAVAVINDTNHLVSERQSVGSAYDACSLCGQLVYIHNLKPGCAKFLCYLRPCRVNGNAVLCNYNIYALSGSDKSCYLGNNAGDAATEQRAYDDAKGAVCRCILVPANGAADTSWWKGSFFMLSAATLSKD